jgi:hypothetical protein
MGLLFYGAASGEDDMSRGLIGLAGSVLGIASAIAIDAAVLARKEKEPPTESFWKSARPSVEPRREGGVAVGLAGTF